MLPRNLLLLCAGAGLAACADLATVPAGPVSAAPPPGPGSDLPPQLLEMVGPNQDLDTVRLNTATGCYIYRYAGPVETTFLPLRTRDGREICVAQDPAAGAAPAPA